MSTIGFRIRFRSTLAIGRCTHFCTDSLCCALDQVDELLLLSLMLVLVVDDVLSLDELNARLRIFELLLFELVLLLLLLLLVELVRSAFGNFL